MRRTLVIGLILLVSFAVFLGGRARDQEGPLEPSAAVAADDGKPAPPVPRDPAADAKPAAPTPRAVTIDAKPSAAIPQDAGAIEKRRHDLLAWNRRTLPEAYDRVGKKDPRWDEPARKALDLAARYNSHEVDPQVITGDVYSAAKAAVDAGCDDPMLMYLHARSSVGADYPGQKEALRRVQVAVRGLATSRYPAFRRAVALRVSGTMTLAGRSPDEVSRKEAERDFDAGLALLEESVAGDEHNAFWETNWLDMLNDVTRGLRTLGVPAEKAYERVDAALARVAGAKFFRLLYRGSFWLGYGWEARTQAFAPAVPEGGFDSLEKRLAVAREAYADAWKLQPGSGAAARGLIEVDKAIGGDRATMELWFDRAMKANGDDRAACWSKLDWLDPKWHGSFEEMLGFGRACRDTKNSRTGITLLVADAHWRIATRLREKVDEYMASPEVWADIQSVYDEYLKHHPTDNVARSKFANFCYRSHHYRLAEVQFVALGDHLTQWSEFPYVPLNDMKKVREHNAKVVMGKEGRITFPGWHFVGGSSDDGEWYVNVPAAAPHQERPAILGADATHVWNCTADGITYGIRLVVLPPALQNQRPEPVLEAARSVVAKEHRAQPRNVRDTRLAARPAQEYDIDLPGPKPMQMRVKTIVLGTMLFELSVTGSKSGVAGDAAREFFDSFAFQPKPGP